MTKMLGKKSYDYNRDDDDPIPKSRIRNEETRQWKKDAEEELSEDGKDDREDPEIPAVPL